MIKVIFDTSDCGEEYDNFYTNYPNIEMSLKGTEYNIGYVVSMFRDFLGAMGYGPSSIDSYIPEFGNIEERINEVFEEKCEELFGGASEEEFVAMMGAYTEDNNKEAVIPFTVVDKETSEEIPDLKRTKGIEDISISIKESVAQAISSNGEEEALSSRYGVKKSVSTWTIEDWREEFRQWMIEQDLWEKYVEYNVDDEDGGFHLLESIDNPEYFVCNAFLWSVTKEGDSFWDGKYVEWARYVERLEGSDEPE